MRFFRVIAGLLLIAVMSLAQTSKPSKPTGLSLPPNMPNIPLFDMSAMDKSVDPCADFFRYACASWMAKNPIPPDQSRWGRFDQLQ